MTELHVCTSEAFGDDVAQLFLRAVSYLGSVTTQLSDIQAWLRLPLAKRERLRQEFAQDRSALSRCVEILIAPPVGLGHKRTSVVHKLHAFTHQLFLLFGQSLEAAGKSLMAFTTDFGVEANMAKTRKAPLSLLCPYAVGVSFEEEGAGDGQDQDEESYIHYNASLQVPGALHILHNLTENALSSMQKFDTVKAAFKQMSRALANQYIREGIVATCFADGLARFHAWRFKTFRDKLIDWRWCSVISFCLAIEPVEGPLREYFAISKYNRRADRPRGDQDDNDDTVNINTFAAAVHDPFVWGYACMLRSLLGIVLQLSTWCEACPCHTPPQQLEGYEVADLTPDPLVGRLRPCIFKGRRAPEMGTGGFARRLDELKVQNAATLVLALSKLEAQKRTDIMNDFNRGVQHLLFVSTLKFSFWNEIPYKLCGLAHWDEGVARQAAQQCLRQWDQAMELQRRARQEGTAPREVHALSKLFLGDGPLRALLLQFADSVPRSDPRMLPLCRALAKLLFVPVVERGIEGKHSLLKRILSRAPRYSGALASIMMRMPALRAYLQSQPDFLSQLCQQMESCCDPYYMMKHIGLISHPSVPAGLSPSSSSRWLPLLCKIVYRQDLKTQFQDYSELQQYFADDDGHDAEAGRPFEEAEAADLPEHEAEVADTPRVDDVALMRRYGLDHFRLSITTDDFLAAVARRVPGVDVAAQVVQGIRALSSFMEADKRGGLVAIMDEDGDEMCFESERPTSATALELQQCDLVPDGEIAMFFRVEHFRPSALKLARGDLSEKFTSDNITITTFTGTPSVPELRCVYAEPSHLQAQNNSFDRSLLVLNDAFFTGDNFRLYKMKCDKELTYSIPSVPSGASCPARLAVAYLVQQKALPVAGASSVALPADMPLRDEALQALARLQHHGCVEAD